MGTGKITLGGVQMAGIQSRKQSNTERAQDIIRQAAKAGAQIVMTPEVALSGFVGGAQEMDMAEPIPGPAVDYFGSLAKELEIYILVGLSERVGEQFCNAMAVLAPDGQLMGVMRKVHINRFETPQGWRNGSDFPVWRFDTATGSMTAGIMICYDREVPESARILMLKGADVIFNPLACTCPTDDIHRCLLRTRAFENECYVFVVNHAAPRINGHSMFFDYRGDIVAELGEEEGVLISTVDLDELNTFRTQGIYGRHHRRPELYSILVDPAGQTHPPEANLPEDTELQTV